MGQSSMSSETPAHPSWISRFCGDQCGGGWGGGVMLGESEETNIWERGWVDGRMGGRMDRWWMDGRDVEREEGVMKGCGGVSGELELIPQHFSRWQIDGERQTTATTEGISFHSVWQRRSRSWLRGLNQPLTVSLCETSFSHMVLF